MISVKQTQLQDTANVAHRATVVQRQHLLVLLRLVVCRAARVSALVKRTRDVCRTEVDLVTYSLRIIGQLVLLLMLRVVCHVCHQVALARARKCIRPRVERRTPPPKGCLPKTGRLSTGFFNRIVSAACSRHVAWAGVVVRAASFPPPPPHPCAFHRIDGRLKGAE